ncbi:hypothetical protein Poli38472_013092 [Pythium oligandrum]|uniref:Matrin-type domain-containing protein n=1 Tax=Pythium oligandrum TaxID=41045 RepID=A0A8K1FAM1_PYTOL|nr:hypothetical protein Poli38472_013092 [Pythium oligandrum]|eukprot:TMW55201.1 hypothetical protein Poli38472_013092 [Pythium oligandrum]
MSELYRNAVCLAPMVRAGTLPLRLLSLRYGADLVYGEEIIDKRIIATTRVENAVLNTVDYVSKNGDSVVFRTCAEEKGKVVFQIGTADPILALKAAEHVAQDVASIDINMGCPKHFSIQGGMGVALMKKPDVACDIVKTLSRNLNIPVSAKIRIFEDSQATIDFAKALENAGAVAVGVHGRRADERPVDDAHWDALAPVVSALSVPILVNGDIFNREDLEKIRTISGASSFLIARGALSNASIFRKEGMLPYTDVVVDYLKVAAETDNVFQNTKYNLSRMLPSKCDDKSVSAPVTVAQLGATKDNKQMFSLWNLQDHLEEYQERFRARAAELQELAPPQPQQPAHAYDDEHVLNRQFYCDVCNVQMLSDKDVELHIKGKRHKKKVRAAASATLSEQVARNVAAAEDKEEASEPERKKQKVKAAEDGNSASPTEAAASIEPETR